jgi:predicted KAP-like P-loop ATPase
MGNDRHTAPPQPSGHPFSSDRPIKSKGEDLLGRAHFADSLARAIAEWRGDDSLVLALFGPWGCGKSSLKNLILDALESSPEDSRPIAVDFNPWRFSGYGTLAARFFNEVGMSLDRKAKRGLGADPRRWRRLGTKWRSYGTVLTTGHTILRSLPALGLVLGVLGLVFLGSGLSVHPAFRTLNIVIGASVLVAAILSQIGAVSTSVGDVLVSLAEAREKTVEEHKGELRHLLEQSRRPILIVIDDIDRLSRDEICDVMQLVKANADFPKTIYLLLCQRDVIEHSIEALAPVSGRDFLDKIVQVPIDVPVLARPQLERVLLGGLDSLLVLPEIQKRFNLHRFQNLYAAGLGKYFITLRDVQRFLGPLSFHLGLFQHSGTMEVNPVDLIALEVFRVFEPDFHRALPGLKAALTETDSSYGNTSDKQKNARKAQIEQLLALTRDERRPDVTALLKELFPYAGWALGGTSYGPGFLEEWERELRVCTSTFFDRYFLFAVPEGDVPQVDVDKFLAATGDRHELVRQLVALQGRGLLSEMLARLEAYKEKVELSHAIPYVTALFDIGDKLPREHGGFVVYGPDVHAGRLIHWLLKREPDKTRRGEILKSAIGDTTGVYLPVREVSIEIDKDGRKKDPDSFIVSEADLDRLKELALGKIRAASASNRLAGHFHLPMLLYCWREWAEADEAQKWVESWIRTPEGLLGFLTSFVTPVYGHTMGDYAGRVRWRFPLKEVSSLVDPERLERAIDNISVEGLPEEQRRAVLAFRHALARFRAGKSPDDPFDRDLDFSDGSS